MYRLAAARSLSSRITAPRSKQAYVRIMQDVRRYRKPNAVHAFRRRTSHSRNVVQCRSDGSPRERLSHRSNARSLAFSAKVRYAVQGIYRHLCENQVGSQRLSQRLCHGRTKAMVRRRYFREPGHSVGSCQNKLQSGITYLGQIDVEFILG